MSQGDAGIRPVPEAAYERWLDALARAGWAAGDRSGERVAVDQALGRVTSAPVAARWASPRTDCAAMDGIAVRAADLAAAPPVPSAAPGGADGTANGTAGTGTGAGTAGAGAVRLPAGLFEWIDTGDPMPDGADTVVVRERLLPQADGSVIVAAPAGGGAGKGAAGEAGRARRTGHAASRPNVRVVGEDFAAGEILVPAGRRLRPGDLAAAGAGGHATVAVARRPVVAIIPTGDEIRPVGAVPRRGDIIDTNSLMLAARCRQLGAVPVVGAIVPDDPDALAAELRRTAAGSDLVLVIAGSSRGRGDHAAAVLAQVGGVAVAGVAVRPGHPALLGHAKPTANQAESPEAGISTAKAGQAKITAAQAGSAGHAGHRGGVAPVIGLPGYPLATAVIFELFAAPVLGMLTGQAPGRDRVAARLDRDWSSPTGVEDWVLVTLTRNPAGGAPCATPARRGAGSISQLARADAWWPIPAGQSGFTAGSPIAVLPITAG